MARTFLCLVFTAALICSAAIAAPNDSDLRGKVDALATPLIEDGAAVGFIVGIFRDGERQVFGYGEVKKGAGAKPDGRTIYEIGSATKALTGVILADMVRRGEVKLDDPLEQHLPEGVRAPIVDDKPITLEHLATHTSGLPRLPDNMSFADPQNPYADYSPEDMYAFLKSHKLRRAPGEHEYSNLGMGLLGHELARIQKKSYAALLAERITKPLGMRDTGIKLSSSQRKRLAPPYDEALEPNKNWDIPTFAGAGGVRSTGADMLKFLAANFADADEPLTQSIRLSLEKRHAMDNGLAMGLGWHIARDGVTRWHNGMTGGYASWMSVVPDRKVGVVVLANTATGKITELGEQLTRAACGIEVTPPMQRTEIVVDAEKLQSYAGVYPITPDFALTVTVEDGKLMVQATAQPKFEVFAESPTKFFYKVVDAQLTFEPGDDGKSKRVILHQNGQDMPADRQD